MLATPTSTPGVPPVGDDWLHEVKWDGVRAMVNVVDGGFRLTNRTDGDITAGYPEVAAGVVSWIRPPAARSMAERIAGTLKLKPFVVQR